MLKYSFRLFDENDNLKLTAVVPADEIFKWLDKYSSLGTVKCYLINESEEN